jgi:uncharacterized protein (DUF58 family)
MREFRYEIGCPATGYRPGHHRSFGRGNGFEFRGHVPLLMDPDPRRLDVHASCRQPHGQLMVRVFRERRAISVFVLADVSASLAFAGVRRKMDVLADLTAAAALSAHRIGDAFGFLGADVAVREELRVAPTRKRGAGLLIAERLRRFVPTGNSAAGLAAAARALGRHRALVFLASDFHFSVTELDALLHNLSRYVVVPVVLWDRAEFPVAGRPGIDAVRDLESGRERLLFMRSALRVRIGAALRERQRTLEACFARHGIRPIMLLDGFDADRMTEYFLDAHASPGRAF